MLKKTGAEKDYISQKTIQLSDYRNQYLDFLKKTGRTRISTNEWIGSSKIKNGLGISNKISSLQKHKAPKLLETIKVNQKNIDKTIKKYEKALKNAKIENAIVITKKKAKCINALETKLM